MTFFIPLTISKRVKVQKYRVFKYKIRFPFDKLLLYYLQRCLKIISNLAYLDIVCSSLMKGLLYLKLLDLDKHFE